MLQQMYNISFTFIVQLPSVVLNLYTDIFSFRIKSKNLIRALCIVQRTHNLG